MTVLLMIAFIGYELFRYIRKLKPKKASWLLVFDPLSIAILLAAPFNLLYVGLFERATFVQGIAISEVTKSTLDGLIALLGLILTAITFLKPRLKTGSLQMEIMYIKRLIREISAYLAVVELGIPRYLEEAAELKIESQKIEEANKWFKEAKERLDAFKATADGLNLYNAATQSRPTEWLAKIHEATRSLFEIVSRFTLAIGSIPVVRRTEMKTSKQIEADIDAANSREIELFETIRIDVPAFGLTHWKFAGLILLISLSILLGFFLLPVSYLNSALFQIGGLLYFALLVYIVMTFFVLIRNLAFV
jgi:hypothetical protein